MIVKYEIRVEPVVGSSVVGSSVVGSSVVGSSVVGSMVVTTQGPLCNSLRLVLWHIAFEKAQLKQSKPRRNYLLSKTLIPPLGSIMMIIILFLSFIIRMKKIQIVT